MGASMGSMACGRPRDEVLERRQQREREVGQQLLRKIVASAADGGVGVDWAALIQKAEELHRRDQEYERRLRRARPSSRGLGGGGSGSGSGSRMSRLNQNLERRRRRKADSTGSFSVNLTTYRNDSDIPVLDQLRSSKSYSGSEPTARDECDHSSNDGSFTLSDGLHTYGSSWEEGLATIHE